MSDYLSRAVERETSAAPAVHPALPSPFDSAKTSSTISELETESSTAGDPSRNALSPGRAKDSSPREALAAVDALWTNPTISAPEQPRKREEAAAKTSAVPADTPFVPSATAALSAESLRGQQPQLPGAKARELADRPVVDARPRAIQATGETVVRSVAEAPANPLQAATEAIVKPPNDPRPKPTHAVAAQGVVRPAPEAPSKEPRAVPVIGERASTLPAAPPARPARGSSEPRSATPPAIAPLTKVVAVAHATIPRISPAPSRPERAKSADTAPSPRPVHITIGRIEVRAVHPPPEPVPRRVVPASPKISLEEYLKQRSGNRP